MLSWGLTCLHAPQTSLPRAADGGRSSAFPQKHMGTDRSCPPQRSRARLPPPAWLWWGESIFPVLPEERGPRPVYPIPRQSKSREEPLQPAVVILDYKVVGDFFVVVV